LVYDVTDKTSLDNIEKYWIPKIIENADEEIELAIIGNKTDLNNERQVSK
jgi:GTPase SAR1 family protein